MSVLDRLGSYTLAERPWTNPLPPTGASPGALSRFWRERVSACIALRERRDAMAKLLDNPGAAPDARPTREVILWRYSAKIRVKTAESVFERLHEIIAPDAQSLCDAECPHVEAGATPEQLKRWFDALDAAIARQRADLRKLPPDHVCFNDTWDQIHVYQQERAALERAIQGVPRAKPGLSHVQGYSTGTGLLIGATLTSDGAWVICGSGSGEIVYASTQDNDIQSIPHRGLIAVPSPDGRLIASAIDEDVMLSDARTGDFLRRFKGHENAALALRFTPDGRAFLSGGKRELFWHDVDDETSIALETEDTVGTIAFIDEGRRFLTAGTLGRITLWDTERRVRIAEMKGHLARISSLAISPAGDRVLSGDETGELRHWRITADGLSLESTHDGLGKLWSVAFVGDGERAVCGSDLGRLIVIDLNGGERTGVRFAVKDSLFAAGPYVVALPGTSRFMSADSNGIVRLWECTP